jgi:hypothetical protein
MTAALFHGENEVAAPGYQPVPIRNWTVVGDELHATITFGPYGGPWAFDRYALFDGDDLVASVPEDCLIKLPATSSGRGRSRLSTDASPNYATQRAPLSVGSRRVLPRETDDLAYTLRLRTRVDPGDTDLATIGPQQRCHCAHECGLAGAIRTEQCGDMARLGDKIEPGEGIDVAETLRDAACFDDRSHDHSFERVPTANSQRTKSATGT